jgi:hypothetical protein
MNALQTLDRHTIVAIWIMLMLNEAAAISLSPFARAIATSSYDSLGTQYLETVRRRLTAFVRN